MADPSQQRRSRHRRLSPKQAQPRFEVSTELLLCCSTLFFVAAVWVCSYSLILTASSAIVDAATTSINPMPVVLRPPTSQDFVGDTLANLSNDEVDPPPVSTSTTYNINENDTIRATVQIFHDEIDRDSNDTSHGDTVEEEDLVKVMTEALQGAEDWLPFLVLMQDERGIFHDVTSRPVKLTLSDIIILKDHVAKTGKSPTILVHQTGHMKQLMTKEMIAKAAQEQIQKVSARKLAPQQLPQSISQTQSFQQPQSSNGSASKTDANPTAHNNQQGGVVNARVQLLEYSPEYQEWMPVGAHSYYYLEDSGEDSFSMIWGWLEGLGMISPETYRAALKAAAATRESLLEAWARGEKRDEVVVYRNEEALFHRKNDAKNLNTQQQEQRSNSPFASSPQPIEITDEDIDNVTFEPCHNDRWCKPSFYHFPAARASASHMPQPSTNTLKIFVGTTQENASPSPQIIAAGNPTVGKNTLHLFRFPQNQTKEDLQG